MAFRNPVLAGALGADVPCPAIPGYRHRPVPGRFPAKWRDMLARHIDQEKNFAPQASRVPDAWADICRGLARFGGSPDVLWEIKKRQASLKWTPDSQNYDIEDHWATPREFLARGGDCEDFALLSYFMLRAAGFSARRLAVVVGFDQISQKGHVITACDIDRKIYILDNLARIPLMGWPVWRFRPAYAVNEKVWTLLVPDSRPKGPDAINPV